MFFLLSKQFSRTEIFLQKKAIYNEFSGVFKGFVAIFTGKSCVKMRKFSCIIMHFYPMCVRESSPSENSPPLRGIFQHEPVLLIRVSSKYVGGNGDVTRTSKMFSTTHRVASRIGYTHTTQAREFCWPDFELFTFLWLENISRTLGTSTAANLATAGSTAQ